MTWQVKLESEVKMKLKKGLLAETVDNCIQLHDRQGFPLVEVYQRLDENGNPIDMDSVVEEMADKICEIDFDI